MQPRVLKPHRCLKKLRFSDIYLQSLTRLLWALANDGIMFAPIKAFYNNIQVHYASLDPSVCWVFCFGGRVCVCVCRTGFRNFTEGAQMGWVWGHSWNRSPHKIFWFEHTNCAFQGHSRNNLCIKTLGLKKFDTCTCRTGINLENKVAFGPNKL